jgi:hypothetical protein
MKSPLLQKTTLIFVLLLFATMNFAVQAQTQSNNRKKITFVPPQGDRPMDSAGGASRDAGRCPQDSQNLTPYVTPVIPANVQRLTSQARPTLFVYVPQTTASKAFLSVQGEKNQQHYQTFVSLQQKGGVVGFSLPDDAPPLTVGITYKWSFVLMCNNKLLPDSPTVTGTIKRIELEPSLNSQLSQKTPLDKASLLGAAGLWYDTLEIIADLRKAQPNDQNVEILWQNLLTSVELEEIATQPLISQR